MSPRRLIALGLALSIPAWAFAKQTDPPASTVTGVTVTAQKPNPLVDRTTEFVHERLPTNQNQQYARFRDPVCVKVQGLPTGFNTFVAQRVVTVAKEVGAPINPAADCKPNVNVIFTARPQAQLDYVAKRRDILLGFFYRAQFKATTTFNRPIQSWYLTRSVGTDGVSALELPGEQCISSHAPGSSPCDIKAPPVKGQAGSRLGNDMSAEIVHSLIIADASKVAGFPINSVADYVAVLALSRWQGLERCSGSPTIVNLMANDCDAGDRPDAATIQDLALLKGLYSMDPRESGAMQRATIAGAIRAADAKVRQASK
jgi:hypothetical protein